MLRWICGFNLKDRNKNTELRELLGLEPVRVLIWRGRLRQFGYGEHKDDDADWIK